MKLIAVLMFSTLIYPSPFMATSAKKVHPTHSQHISAKILHAKHEHSGLVIAHHNI